MFASHQWLAHIGKCLSGGKKGRGDVHILILFVNVLQRENVPYPVIMVVIVANIKPGGNKCICKVCCVIKDHVRVVVDSREDIGVR